MSRTSSRSKQDSDYYSIQKLRFIGRTKWEYPLPKSKAYWQKFCDDEEKRLVRSKMCEEATGKSRASADGSIVDTDGESDAAESESPESGIRNREFSYLRETRKDLWARNIGEREINECEHLQENIAEFSTVRSKSLSAKHGKRSTNVLDTMPRISCFRRKNRDRCLSCMHKALPKAYETEVTRSRAAFLTKIGATSDSESSSDGLSEFHEELQMTLHLRKKAIPKYPRKTVDVADQETGSFHRMEREDVVISTRVDSNQFKSKTSKLAESSRSPKSPNTIPSTISVSSERSKVSSSEGHTSDDEETSTPLALDGDPSRYKNMAPCHLPTILLPSMEPLQALKQRKPTTLESRIALMESTVSTKEKSDEEGQEDDDVRVEILRTAKEKPRLKTDEREAEKIDVRQDAPSSSPSVLLKLKSEQQLISPIVQFPRRDELRREYSCASVEDLSKDSTRGTLGAPRGETEDERGEVISSEKLDSAKEPVPSGSMETERRARLLSLTVVEIERFLDEATRREGESIANEFSSRLIRQRDDLDAAAIRRAKLAARLTKLLANSKRYSSPDKFPSDLIFSAKQSPICNSRLLRRALPLDSYNLVAPLLGMPTWYPKRHAPKVKSATKVRYEDVEETDSEIPFDSLVVHPPTTRDISTCRDERKVGQARWNPYALFLRRPRRKVVTWRPLTAVDLKGYDPEATLEMRARNITDKICRDFCQWLRDLGGADSTVDEEVLRDMFEIDFTTEASRAMQVSMREMPVVPDAVAAARQCPDARELVATRKHLIRDARAEGKPARTVAFGTAMPRELRFAPPTDRVRETWLLRCENVKPDLETMDAVWKGITHLESVQAFVKWLREHPEMMPLPLPDALKNAMTTDPSKYVRVDDETLAQLEATITEQIGDLKVGDARRIADASPDA